MNERMKQLIENPKRIFFTLGHYGLLNWISDEKFLKTAYKIRMKKALNLESPTTYNEKLQWLKLHDRKPIYTQMVDKYEAKRIVADRIGEQYIIPTLGVWDRFEDIDFEKLPEKFVLKCTHDSGSYMICQNKESFNYKAAKKKFDRCLKLSFYWTDRQWPYKDIKPRIIAEEYMEDDATKELRDYKFFTFNGEVKALFIATDRGSQTEDTKFDFFDENFNHLPITNGHPNANPAPEKPLCFEEMKKLASVLGKGIPQVRVDFYEVNGKVYFGEMTFFHWSGMVPFEPDEWDRTFGDWIDLELIDTQDDV